MALPFIVGPHQCSLTQGPDGRPQVEVVLRVRLPLAEFFDALLLTLAEQHPLFPQGGHEPDPASIAPVKAGLQAKERRSPPVKEEPSPKRKTAGRIQPKKPAHPPMQTAKKAPQSSSCPGQPARGNCRQSILRCTFDPARRSGNWHPTYRNCGLAELPATTDCQASTFGHKSGGRDLHGVLCAA